MGCGEGTLIFFLKEGFIWYFEVLYVLFHHCIFLAENGMHVLWVCTTFQNY